jgi:hypothetical protein
MKRAAWRYYRIGLLVAALEEFITQGVLKQRYVAWFLPTLIAFGPFLVIVRGLDVWLRRVLSEERALLVFFAVAGGIGISFEWLVMGLTPWRDPGAPWAAVAGFQAGMFSFWAHVAFAPRVLTDGREAMASSVRFYRRLLVVGMTLIYAVAFAVPQRARFGATIVSVLAVFLSLNAGAYRYGRDVRDNVGAVRAGPQDGRHG